MLNKTQVQIVITIAVAVWAVMLALQGVALKTSYLRPYSVAVGAAVLLMLGYERWFWRWPVLKRLARRPIVHGTWAGILRSSWIDPSSGELVPPIPVYLSISQSYSTLALRLMTAESSSESMAISLIPPRNGSPAVIWSAYVNTPGLSIQHRSRIHRGTVRLEVHGAPDRLIGTYWTDRRTAGEIELDRHIPRLHTGFAGADAEFDSARLAGVTTTVPASNSTFPRSGDRAPAK
jgi:hypothetical protein